MNIKNMSYDEKVKLANNPSTPEYILRELAKDENFGVRLSISFNPESSSNTLIALFEHEKNLKDPNTFIINNLYKNVNLPAFAKRVIETLFREML